MSSSPTTIAPSSTFNLLDVSSPLTYMSTAREESSSGESSTILLSTAPSTVATAVPGDGWSSTPTVTTSLYSTSTTVLYEPSSLVPSSVSSLCACKCGNNLLSAPLDSSEIEQITSSIQKELYVDKRDVSATKRKYISVNDQRPSAQTVGYFGVCIVAVTFTGIFLLDITSLGRDIMQLVNDCKSSV
ncbi:sushi, von Willebrand factor type a, egf and pentraxin domain-containing protein 1 [Plakobranchus ocellatus]|uniref:Sushi, von Willebrand factor type a, egf and pentraxin domain-containing protein 1 n=1 Tax=Plakobranchus ocellatus TaxID=259542 RepID=A0AAV4DUP7_9GAST|nr:sushi, von Willebrand factor type a, egf and pentraxin domain-containing protein 1 [Plakobranchus ocellatus]